MAFRVVGKYGERNRTKSTDRMPTPSKRDGMWEPAVAETRSQSLKKRWDHRCGGGERGGQTGRDPPLRLLVTISFLHEATVSTLHAGIITILLPHCGASVARLRSSPRRGVGLAIARCVLL